jgi:hypothetical protein
MKKWFIIAAIIAIPVIVWAQSWFPANQKTMQWDAVTTLEGGAPLPSGSTVKYVCYTKTPTVPTPVQVGVSDIPQFTFTFTVEGKYYLGVRSQRIEAGAVISESAISWSNDPLFAQAGNTFGIVFYYNPAAPGGLRAE